MFVLIIYYKNGGGGGGGGGGGWGKNEFKKNYIKNHACYYFGYIVRVIDINSRDILLDEKIQTYFNL